MLHFCCAAVAYGTSNGVCVCVDIAVSLERSDWRKVHLKADEKLLSFCFLHYRATMPKAALSAAAAQVGGICSRSC